jgi:Spy/CpxP family protein refolding chaperone
VKPIIAVLAFLLLSSGALAQEPAKAPADPEAQRKKLVELVLTDVASAKSDLVAKNMELTADENTKFWPVYQRYEKERMAIGRERVQLMKDYSDSVGTLDAKKANSLLARSLDRQAKLEQLRRRFVKDFQKVLSPEKTVRFYFVDHTIDTLIEARLVSEFPLVY